MSLLQQVWPEYVHPVVSPPLGSSVGEPDLYPGLTEPSPLTQGLPCLEVWIVSVTKLLLQVFQLCRLKGASAPAELWTLILSILPDIPEVSLSVSVRGDTVGAEAESW